MSRSRVKVAVCIVTYRRPQGLSRLLEAINAQVFRPGLEPDLRVVVVDNDPERTAAEPTRAAAGWLTWPLAYVSQPLRGISHARNTAIEGAGDTTDFIAFVDDDEIPSPDWLDQLLRVQHAYDADVVTGPVLSVFETPVPRWLADEPIFTRPRFPTGTRVDIARTGNVLIRASVVGATFRFDPRFGLSGGEDTLLFLQLAQAGCKIVWADEAVVSELVPASRATVAWSLKRCFRTGNSWSLCEREVRPAKRVRLLRLAKGALKVLQGICVLPTALVVGPRGMIHGLRHICMGAGNAAGALGLRYQPYREPDGCR